MKLAVIPARGGSKRITRKNIRPFHGRPMLVRAIETALASGVVGRNVVVSSDDEEILELAKAHGAISLKRPAELADDHATTAQVMAHAVAMLNLNPGDCACCLYPCTPFVRPSDLYEGLLRLEATRKCYVFPVTEFSPPIMRALRLDGAAVHPVWPQFNNVRNQDLEPRYRDAGQWYWGWAEAWEKEVPIYFPTSVAIVLPRLRAIDIDTELDWQFAAAMYAISTKDTV